MANQEQGGQIDRGKGGSLHADRAGRELQRLRRRIRFLEKETRALRSTAARLEQRIEEDCKELSCLYAFSGIMQDHSRSLLEIAELLVETIPLGWRKPELTCACITLEGVRFESRNFRLSSWSLSSDIVPDKEPVGTVEVHYLGTTRIDPFRAGEQELLDDLAGRFSRIVRRKHAEQMLKEKEGYYREVFEKSNYGIAVTDSAGRFLDCNRAFLDLLGYASTEELQASSYDEITPPEYHSAEETFLLEQPAASGYSEGFEKEFLRKSGERIPVFIKVWTRRDLQGRPTGRYIIIRDRTRRIVAQESLRKQERELADKSIHLEEVNTALRVLLKHRDEDRRDLERSVLANIQKLVLPYLENLKAAKPDPRSAAAIQIIETNLNDIASPFLSSLTASYAKLSGRETQVAGLVREGRTTKEIAAILGVSSKAVDLYRNGIRKKLGITKQKVNLRSFLSSLS